MSQREFMIVLAHADICSACRSRLLSNPEEIFARRPLSAEEKGILAGLKFEDFITPGLLAQATASSAADLDAYRDQPVVRLRHL